jgi:hypothetical protein
MMVDSIMAPVSRKRLRFIRPPLKNLFESEGMGKWGGRKKPKRLLARALRKIVC